MKKPVRVILLDNADLEYKRLNEIVGKQLEEGKENTEEMQLLRSINQKRDLIRANPFYGDNIEKKKIPRCIIMYRTCGVLSLRVIGECYTLLKEMKCK